MSALEVLFIVDWRRVSVFDWQKLTGYQRASVTPWGMDLHCSLHFMARQHAVSGIEE